jgi:dTDP-4-amino-4,6-dideoxygalactose transaminase
MRVGSVGQLAATSFYPTKNLGALGDGGAILTDAAEFDRVARVLRDYGQGGKYRHEEIGYNSRLDEFQAAILRRVHLPLLEIWTMRRRGIAGRCRSEIGNPRVTCLPAPPRSEPVYHLFPVMVEDGVREDFIEHMRAQGVMCGEHYPTLIPDQPAMNQAQCEIATPLDHARRIAAREVSLPVHPYLEDAEVDRVIEAVNRW